MTTNLVILPFSRNETIYDAHDLRDHTQYTPCYGTAEFEESEVDECEDITLIRMGDKYAIMIGWERGNDCSPHRIEVYTDHPEIGAAVQRELEIYGDECVAATEK
jgi:hypothetical protein